MHGLISPKMLSKQLVRLLKKLCINRPEVISRVISEASKCNTYVETINPHVSDALHWNVKRDYPETLTSEFFRFSKELMRKLRFGSVDLIADVTEENFYGTHTGLYTHGWTGERGVVSRFHYLVVSALFRNKIIPFYVEILPIGVYIAEALGKALDWFKGLNLHIRSVLLDRGFYSGDVLNTLQVERAKYLVFVPKNKWVKRMINDNPQDCVLEHEIKYTKNKRNCAVSSSHVFFHEQEDYTWVFATNIQFEDMKMYVSLYKKRWNIETMFRVHDEARIKTKSVQPEIRLFYFLISMLFLLIWNLYAKDKSSFKRFIIQTCEEIKQLLKKIHA